MKRRLVLSVAVLLVGAYCYAGNGAGVDEISIDTRAAFHQQFDDEEYGSRFQGEYLNLHVLGTLSDNLSFRIRHRFNKGVNAANPFNATDFLYLKWDMSEHWALTAGKQPILVGGYEIDAPPIDVYYFGAFSSNLHLYYAFGASVTYSPVKGQDVVFQVVPSPVSPVTDNRYSYNLYWNGGFSSWWDTIWSVNLVEDERCKMMNWISLGNKFHTDRFFVDVDFINRASFHQKRMLFSDWSLIANAVWSIGKWNLCSKFGYERNDAANVDADGASYDLAFTAGSEFFYGGAGVEYFPLGNDRLRLHAVFFRNNRDKINNIDIGITWRARIFSR